MQIMGIPGSVRKREGFFDVWGHVQMMSVIFLEFLTPSSLSVPNPLNLAPFGQNLLPLAPSLQASYVPVPYDVNAFVRTQKTFCRIRSLSRSLTSFLARRLYCLLRPSS